MTEKILVLGSRGQLGRALQESSWPDGAQCVAMARDEINICDQASIREAIAPKKYGVIINAAAYTAVDRAEDNIAEAWRVNALGPAILAQACRDAGAQLIHISTDYVFHGGENNPILPEADCRPRSVYGASKRGGELAIQTACVDHKIVRTSWVYDSIGKNFVTTMLNLAEERDEISVVADQWGSPTSSVDLAEAIIKVATDKPAWEDADAILHFSNSGTITWADFAEEIFRQSALRGGPQAQVKRITTSDYPTAADRPPYSSLDCTSLTQAYGIIPKPWQDALAQTIDDILGVAK